MTSSHHMPHDAVPARRSSFRLLAIALPQLDARRNLLIGQLPSEIVSGAVSRYRPRRQYESLAVPLFPLTFCSFQSKGRGHERACVRMLRRLKDALSGAVFDHLALAHDYDLITEGTYHLEIMANE